VVCYQERVREQSRWDTCFGRWVTDIGVGCLTVRLIERGIPVTRNAVYNWVAGAHPPPLLTARALVEISRGSDGRPAITFDDICRQRELALRSRSSPS
jgi:hypothetical protein